MKSLAVLCDYPEEEWPSMDLCAEMILEQMRSRWLDRLATSRVCPPFRRRFGAVPIAGGRPWAHNADRFLNRLWYFPRYLRGEREKFDLFHLCDHSYSQLVLELPPARTGVFCHDLDTFRCLLEPAQEPRPAWFRWMMRRVLRGFRQAAVVFHTTMPMKADILRYGLIAPEKLVYAPLGHAEEFCAEPNSDDAADRILAELEGKPFLLHVGSCIPRKRVDFLLELFAAVRTRMPELRLIKVGGAWTAGQAELIERHGLKPALVHVQGLKRATLAALYRQAALVLLPSDAEGFGLPVLEALACGALVLASDLATLREVAGSAALYAPVLDLECWRDQVQRLLADPRQAPPHADRLARGQQFTWEKHVRIIAEAYLGLGT